MDNGDPARDAIHEAIQQNAPKGSDALLTGWALVTEWVDHDGERWLSKAASASSSTWAVKGMHHEALFGDWPDDDED